ncbi:MAG TPA: hypothetical protein VFV34_12145 [Blastocatellia bacterium]|nr:hypothetical protein [Blastocatellia bacterium]
MSIKPAVKLLYGVFGVACLAIGATVFLLPTGLLPDAVENRVLNFGHDDLGTLHIIQELGSILIFAGLITFWFIRHYEQSPTFHWALTVCWAFLALAHWFDAKGHLHSGTGQLIDTIPFILFVLVGLLRNRAEGKAARSDNDGR